MADTPAGIAPLQPEELEDRQNLAPVTNFMKLATSQLQLAAGQNDPAAAGNIDVSAFMTGIKSLNDQIMSAGRELLGMQQQNLKGAKEEQTGIASRATADTSVALLDAQKADRLEAMNAESSAIFGTNKAANSFILAGLGQEILSQQADITARTEDIKKRQDTNFFEDPVQWLANQVIIPYKQDSLRTVKDQQAQESAIADELLKRTDQIVTLNAKTAADDAMTRYHAVSQKIAAQAQVDLGQSQQRMVAEGLTELNVRAALNNNQFSAVKSVFDAQSTMFTLKQQGQATDRATVGLGIGINTAINEDITSKLRDTNIKLNTALQKLEIDAKGGTVEARQTLNIALARAAQTLGAIPPTVEQFNRMDVKTKELWNSVMSDSSVMAEGMLGYNAGYAVEKIANTPGLMLGSKERATYQDLNNIKAGTMDRIAKDPTHVPWERMTPDQRASEIQKDIMTKLAADVKNIPDRGSIFSPAGAKSVLSIPAVTATTIGNDLALQARSDNAPLRAQDVVTAAVQHITAKDMTPAQAAAEIATIYNSVLIDNNTLHQYSKFGIIPPSAATTGYHTSIMVNNFSAYTSRGDTPQILDMTNEAELATFLTRAGLQITTSQGLFDKTPAKKQEITTKNQPVTP